jgi:PAS domain S-box-containing protein
VIVRAKTLSLELETPIAPGFDALVFKASRGIEDIYELTYIRKDGSRFPAVVSVTALRAAQGEIIGYLLIGTDNTARKQAEEALLKAGALQNAIFNSANFSSIATDARGVIQIFNVGAERMLGYAAAEVTNKITPADISDPQEVIARAKTLSAELSTPITPGFEALVFKASRGIEDIYELTYIRKDGSRFPAVVSVTALRDAQGKIIGYLLIGTDNTARKQAEEALLKAGALQNAILNSANFSSIATDAKGVIQIFNVGAERMLGYTAAEVINKITPADISDPQEVIVRAETLSQELETSITPGFEALVFKASRGIEDIYELTYIRKDGSRFPAVVSVTALRDSDGGIIGYLLIGTDDTARKQVEAERMELGQRLRDHQFYTRSLFESNIDALMTADPSGIITDVNKQMEALTDCTRDELIGAPFKNHFSDPVRAEASIKRVLSQKKLTNYELTARTRSGKETVVSFNATTIYDRNRRLQGVFAAARDITEHKLFEQELGNHHHVLEALVSSRTAELAETRDAAEAANRTKSQFLANMSHEIRTPINAVLGFANLCLNLNLAPRERDYLLKIHSASGALLSIVNDILDFSKIDAGMLTLESIPFSIDEVLLRVSSLFSLDARKKGVELVIGTLPGVPDKLLGDPMRLGQVLINLMSNSVKFTERGEINLTVEPVLVRSDAATLRFSVRDSGLGITLEQQASLFGAFSQADSSTTRKYGGTGLGLALSKQLVERMGGAMRVESSASGGSCFSFTAHFGVAASPVGTALPLAGKTVLVIEDNAAMRKLLCYHVQSFGCEVESFASGALALDKVKSGAHFDLILIDWHMEGLDGVAVARQLRADSHQAPIIMISGDEPEMARGLIESGDIQAFLCKPVPTAVLRDAMLDVLAGLRVRPMQAKPSAALPALKGARILVVEDNDFNRQVCRELIELTGAVVRTADDGAQAVAAVANGGVDLVLMDIQMPVMDGYTATRIIRERWPNLPVIALTAHALSEERPRVLAVGMNDILTKPILPETLYTMLAHWLKKINWQEASDAELPLATEAPSTVLDTPPVYCLTSPVSVNLFDLTAALTRVNGDRKMLERFLGVFRSRNAGIVEKIGAALALDELHPARQLAHALKGGAGTIGMVELEAAAARLEASLGQALQGSDHPTSRFDDFATLEAAWSRTQETLATLLDTPSVEQSPANPA